MRNTDFACLKFVVRHVALVGLLAGCASESGQTGVALPTGHYEGPIRYQGTELRVEFDLREAAPGQLEADLRIPEIEGWEMAVPAVSYTEPQLRLGPLWPGGIRLSALREGDFLRGVFALDSVQADFVWARRGQAAARSYQEGTMPATAGLPRLTVLVPQDTAAQHPAVALFADAAHRGAATARAAQLARQGFVTTTVTTPPAPADSTSLRAAAAVLQALRRHPAVDTLRVGLWARGTAAAVAPAAVLAKPKAAFVVLENAPLTSADETKPLQVLGRQRIPLLGLYAAADTSLNARESARRLRTAVSSRRGALVRSFPQADANFLVPGRLSPDGKWTWPRPAPGYVRAVQDWLKK